MNFKSNEGITLVELVVAMATSTLVFAAAATLLLLGLRINNLTTGTTIRQNKTRTVLTVMERLATEGKITGTEAKADFWKIMEDENVRFTYNAKDQAIYVGDPQTAEEKAASIILNDVYASHVVLDESNVLTLAVETEDGSFTTSVFCRLLDGEENTPDHFEDIPLPEIGTMQNASKESRKKFIDKLNTQYRLKGGTPNRGLTLSEEGLSMGMYYSEWYIKTKYPQIENGETKSVGELLWEDGSWNKDTPWCACFVSWALTEVQAHLNEPAPMYAEVDSFMSDLVANGKWKAAPVAPGDLVFFDWSMGNDPDHVGVYLNTIDGYVYTIEGNSAGMVAVRRYQATDKRIIGYGVLNWK